MCFSTAHISECSSLYVYFGVFWVKVHCCKFRLLNYRLWQPNRVFPGIFFTLFCCNFWTVITTIFFSNDCANYVWCILKDFIAEVKAQIKLNTCGRPPTTGCFRSNGSKHSLCLTGEHERVKDEYLSGIF